MGRWWVPLVLLVLCFAVIGLRYGWRAATLTETDVINRYAAQYLAETGGGAQLSDCAATPAPDGSGLWLILRCMAPGAAVERQYLINRFGGLEGQVDVSPEPSMPQT